jgi:AcrR family transcriptional regulator
MDSQVTRSRQRILESAVALLREGNLPGQLVEAAAAAARVPLASAKQFFRNDEELILAFYLRLANDLEVRASALPSEGVTEPHRLHHISPLIFPLRTCWLWSQTFLTPSPTSPT